VDRAEDEFDDDCDDECGGSRPPVAVLRSGIRGIELAELSREGPVRERFNSGGSVTFATDPPGGRVRGPLLVAALGTGLNMPNARVCGDAKPRGDKRGEAAPAEVS